MAPESASAPKRKPKESQYLFNLGVQGRKTGLTIPTGVRDEHGLEPMDHLFSSPEKPKENPSRYLNGSGNHANATLSEEEDMDVVDSTIPEPLDVIAERKRAGMRLPPPRSKSPIKTYLKSPARRHPSMGLSSPSRPAAVVPRAASTSAPVRRRLDFSNSSFDESGDQPENYISPQKRGGSAMPAIGTSKIGQSSRFQPALNSPPNEADDSLRDDSALRPEEDEFQLLDATGEDEMQGLEEPEEDSRAEEEPEPEDSPEPVQMKKGKGKAKAVEVEVKQAAAKRGRPKKQAQPTIQEEDSDTPVSPIAEVVEPTKKKGGRPRKNPLPEIVQGEEQSSPAAPSPVTVKAAKKPAGRPKRPLVTEQAEESRSDGVEEEEQVRKKLTGRLKRPVVAEDEEEPRPAKRTRRPLDGQKTTTGKVQTKEVAMPKNASKAKGRKPKLDAIAESDSPLVIRGPPIPRNNPGLFIFRRETPMEGVGFKQTRSGRNSIKPVDYWKGEKIEYNTDATEDPFGKKNFLMPTIKEVVRTDVVEQPRKARAKSKAPTKARKRAESESEDEAELEPWELEPGVVHGEIRVWDPIDQLGSQSEELEQEIAYAAGAIVTVPIPNASFRFAKTLTLPFFGSGMVELPPGGVKKLKNSRKMQMVFFVHRGRVQVTVNDTIFRIGQGGMWQVPRGNFYSIENDYDKEARIFFSQGCEAVVEGAGESTSH